MQIMRPCTAVVLVESRDSGFVEFVRQTLSNEQTIVGTLTHEPGGSLSCCSSHGHPDVIVIDRQTVTDVFRSIRRLRRRWPTCALIAANAQTDDECAQLLEEGADDASTARDALFRARLHAMSRRARTMNADTRVVFGDLIVDRERRRVWSGGNVLTLSPREYAVLVCLFHYAPLPVGRETLTEFVWSGTDAPAPNAVEVYVGYLRRKLACGSRVVISTIRGVGYALAINTASTR